MKESQKCLESVSLQFFLLFDLELEATQLLQIHKKVIKALKRHSAGLLALPSASGPDETLTFATQVGRNYKVNQSFAVRLKGTAVVLSIKVMEIY